MRRSFRRAAAAKLDCREQLHRQQLAVGWAAAVQAAAKVWGVAGSFFRSSPLLRREEQLAAECCSAAYPRLLAAESGRLSCAVLSAVCPRSLLGKFLPRASSSSRRAALVELSLDGERLAACSAEQATRAAARRFVRVSRSAVSFALLAEVSHRR